MKISTNDSILVRNTFTVSKLRLNIPCYKQFLSKSPNQSRWYLPLNEHVALQYSKYQELLTDYFFNFMNLKELNICGIYISDEYADDNLCIKLHNLQSLTVDDCFLYYKFLIQLLVQLLNVNSIKKFDFPIINSTYILKIQ